jgi:hypothetical protein
MRKYPDIVATSISFQENLTKHTTFHLSLDREAIENPVKLNISTGRYKNHLI